MSDLHPDAEPEPPPSRYTATPAPASRYTATPAPASRYTPTPPPSTPPPSTQPPAASNDSRYTPTPVVARQVPRAFEPRPHPVSPVTTGVSVVDIIVAVVGVGAVIAMGLLMYGNSSFIGWVFGHAGCCSLRGRILAYQLLQTSPFAIAAICACFSRVPWLGVLLAALGQITVISYLHFHWHLFWHFVWSGEWPLLIVILAFALGDALLAAAGRSIPVGIFVGLIVGVGMTLVQAIGVNGVDVRKAFEHDPWLFLQIMVVPGVVVFLACVSGSWLGVISRRATVTAP